MDKIRPVIMPEKKVRQIKESRLKSQTISLLPSGQANKNQKQRVEEELLRACLSEGMSRDDILLLMNINENQYAVIEKRLLANDGQRNLSMSAAHRYYLFCLQQEQCVRDLDQFVQQSYESIANWNKAAKIYGSPGVARKILGSAPTTQSAVLAIKAKSEILERVIKTGQDLGIVQKRAKEIRVSGQLNLAALPTEQLRETLRTKLVEFENLVSKGNLPDTYQRMLMDKNNERESIRGREFESEQVMDAEFEEV